MNYRDNHTHPITWRTDSLDYDHDISEAARAIASMRNTQYRDDSTQFGYSTDYVDASEVCNDWLKVGGTS